MIKEKIIKYLGYFLIFLMLAMLVDVLWGVFTRYVMGSQASWTEELARFLLIWISILGAAWASSQKMHLAIDLLEPKLVGKQKKRMAIFINCLIIFFAFSVMLIGGSRLMYITNVLGQLSPALRVPMYVVYSVVPLSGLFIIYFKISDGLKIK